MSDDNKKAREDLDAIAERIDRVLRGPAAIESQLLFRIARPIFAMTRWRASMQSAALTKLLTMLCCDDADGGGGAGGLGASDPEAPKTLAAAIDELEANVGAIERVAIVRKRAPAAHAQWLRRVHTTLALAQLAIAHGDAKQHRKAKANAANAKATTESDADDANEALGAARAVARTDASALLPPLVPVRKNAASSSTTRTSSVEVPLEDDPELEDARLVDLELAAIDHLMAAARAETLVLGRKRRLLIAARQRLLEASAALPLDREGVRERTRYLAREITRIDRFEGAGLSTDVSLLHQARQALTRRDPKRLFATLSALDANALAAADRDVSARTGDVLARITKNENRKKAMSASLRRSAVELLGDVVASKVSEVIDEARSDARRRYDSSATSFPDRKAAKEYLDYLPENAEAAILHAAVAADGFFEVGGALLPVRVAEEERVLRVVRHPTQKLLLMPAEDVQDLRDAVIGDPRSVLLDLATGRLFARRFVGEEVKRRSRIILQGEVRVYVLDGSGSMRGPRARVRDAILVAELSTLMRRLDGPSATGMRCTLFYRYFTEELGPVSKIESVAAAQDAIRDIVTVERFGGTDIQLALLSSLQQIAESRATDEHLARAQIVLVTDGASAVDEEAIVAAREAMVGLPIGVSVIALGEENGALRDLVARQRAKGEAAFYHFIDDAELVAITEGMGNDELLSSIHPPDRWTQLVGKKDDDALARALDDEVGGLLEDLEELDRQRDHNALERLEEEVQARREVGLSTSDDNDDDDLSGGSMTGDDGSRARMEALRKDRIALGARYARWFPPVSPTTNTNARAASLPAPGTTERDDIDSACCALASVAEVVALLGGSAIARQADAIDLFERLLPDARLSHGRYRAVLRDYPNALEPSLRALHDSVRGPTPSTRATNV